MTYTNEFVKLHFVYALVASIVGGVMLWNLYFRYEDSAVNAFVSADSSVPTRLEREKNRRSTWLVKNRGVTVGEASLKSAHAGHYEFTVTVSNDPTKLAPGSTYVLVAAGPSVGGVIACTSCARLHGGSPIMPALWSLSDV